MAMPAPATTPVIIAWTATANDLSAQYYIRIAAAMSSWIDTLRAVTLSAHTVELRQQAITLQLLLLSNLSTWALSGLPSYELSTCLRAERDKA